MAAGLAGPSHRRVYNRLRGCRILRSVTAGAFRVLIVAALLVCDLAIVISPFVDLPATALRARTAALLCLLALISIAFSMCGIHIFSFKLAPEECVLPPPAKTSADVTCRWLC